MSEYHDWPGDGAPSKEQADDEWLRERWKRIEAAARDVTEHMPGMPVFSHGKHTGEWRYADEMKWPTFAAALTKLRKALGTTPP